MAKFSNVNTSPATGSVAMYNFKEVLKAAGWTVPSSSDGTTYNSSGDQITSGGSGANGMSNSRAWFRIQDPGARREYVVQNPPLVINNGASSIVRLRSSRRDHRLRRLHQMLQMRDS